MATPKLETAADRYKRIRADKESKSELFDVECKDAASEASFAGIEGCGMVWKARRAAPDLWVTSGILPSALAAKMASVLGKGTPTPDKILKNLDDSELVQSIDFSNKIVRYTAVEPRIVDVVEGPNDVQRADVMTCCYNTLLRWQMSGGDEAARLETFRK